MKKSTKRFIWALIVSFAFGLLASSLMFLLLKDEITFGIMLCIIWVFLGSFAACFFVYTVIWVFPIEKEEIFAENWYEAKERICRCLHSDFYIQVYYRNNTNKTSKDLEMFQKIAQNPECKFYAKLNEQEYIELIAKDKNEQIVYMQIIRNFVFFEEYFEMLVKN